MFKFSRIFSKPIKIDSLPDIEEYIYHTLHSQRFYLQIGFPENTPLYGTVIIYQLQIHTANREIWISNLGAQTHTPQQEFIPVLILAPPYIHIPQHGPETGA